MNTVGVLLLAAATATSFDGFGYSKPGVGGRKLLRPHAVVSGPPPAGGMIGGPGMGAPGCGFGHPGCGGGPTCPGGGGAAGAMGPGGGARRFPNVRSQLYFVEPLGMRIGWQTAASNGERIYLPAQLTVPARYNFAQGYIYRLKLTDIAGRPGLTLYPTLEVAPSTPATDAYLTHNPIPVQFTAEDFDQVVAGNFVTKVIYLPDPKYQELATGVETLVSTRLEPGIDPVIEADRRGTILMIVRLGGIDLEMPTNGAVASVPGGGVMNAVGGPGTFVPGPDSAPFAPMAPAGPAIPSGPIDSAPVSSLPPSGEPTEVPAPAETPAPPVPSTPPGEGDMPAEPVPPPGGPGLGGLLPPAEAPGLGELPPAGDAGSVPLPPVAPGL